MVDISGRKLIGQRSGDWDDTMGETFIRGFKEGETKLRALQVTDDWWRIKEHYYGPAIGFGPCSEEPDCTGCNDASEKVRGTSAKYLANCLNDKGKIVVFKFPVGIKTKLASREQRISPTIVLDRDLVIVRIGTDFKTEYDFEFGKEYPIEDWPGEDELHDLPTVTIERYVIVEQMLSGGASVGDAEPAADEFDAVDRGVEQAHPEPEAEPEKPKEQKKAAKKTAAKKAASSRQLGEGQISRSREKAEPEAADEA